MPVTRKAKQPRRRVINNHDGGAKELVRRVPADWDRLARESVGVLAGTQVDTLFWHIGAMRLYTTQRLESFAAMP